MDGNVIQCSCRRIFAQLSTYTNHQHTCKKRKKCLSGALAKAKLAWDNRKKRRTGDNADEHGGDSGTSGISNLLNTDHVDGQGRPQELELQFPHNEFNRQSVSAHVQFDRLDSVPGSGLLLRALRFFTTLANSFGLSRRYYGDWLPTHDAEDATTLQHLTLMPSVVDNHDSAGHPADSALFYPYLNRSSYLLGDWYWNGRIQKSKESFRNLIKIVGTPEFQPGDVNTMRWDFINAQLQAGAEETGLGQSFEGASWTKTTVTIRVPFHKRMAKPGVYDYHVGDMYHHKLISII
ncbi:hypothetical protein SCLCIDRAFT_117349 [Scleroderma citrinum Foug A]|uniref:Uncharacterized protein n=1 Tax=Scleroderma citrinum Foug A TaxID=1036808 RepID=A0A0C3AEN6_9AGAM|nr:hypothetical protein SCLCIDRAFT_117349 [Scleroderma citrinum Foug A]